MKNFKWQLVYKDGSYQDQGVPSNSIRGGKAGAKKLNICNDNFEILATIDLSQDWLPVVYRIKQMEMNISGILEEPTSITVFGKYNPATDNLVLFEWESNNNTYSKCRPSYIDWIAIRNCTNTRLEVIV